MFILKETVNTYLEKKFKEYKEKEAIVYPEENIRLTYDELESRINQFAKGFISIGIKKGMHVSILAPACPDWIVTFLALTKVGAVPVCLNDSNTLPEIKYAITHSDSVVLVASTESMGNFYDEGLLRLVDKVVFLEQTYATDANVIDIDELIAFGCHVSDQTLLKYQKETSCDDILTIQYTSGTTGKPKAVMSVHNRVLTNVKIFLDNFGYSSEDRILSALPLYHVMGCLFTGLLTFMTGGTLVLIKRFKSKHTLEIFEKENITSFHGVPTMYKLLMRDCQSYQFDTLKKGMLAGAYCGPETVKEIQEKLHIENIFPCYGQSEGVGFTQIRMDDALNKKLTTVGRPVDGVKIKIIDEKGKELPPGKIGEIIVYMPYHMAGYYKDEKATRETIQNGWIFTGDLGCLDREGYLTVKGRKKEIIIRGGENISPTEIEDIIRGNGLVEEIAVTGVRDSVMGEEVVAFIKMKFLTEYTKNQLNDYIQLNVAKFKRPKYLFFIEEFPMTSSGKIKKNQLLSMYLTKLNANVG